VLVILCFGRFGPVWSLRSCPVLVILCFGRFVPVWSLRSYPVLVILCFDRLARVWSSLFVRGVWKCVDAGKRNARWNQ
jgi:hypothetical protein